MDRPCADVGECLSFQAIAILNRAIRTVGLVSGTLRNWVMRFREEGLVREGLASDKIPLAQGHTAVARCNAVRQDESSSCDDLAGLQSVPQIGHSCRSEPVTVTQVAVRVTSGGNRPSAVRFVSPDVTFIDQLRTELQLRDIEDSERDACIARCPI